jgi:transcriptional regulator with XRE-family HTH domain
VAKKGSGNNTRVTERRTPRKSHRPLAMPEAEAPAPTRQDLASAPSGTRATPATRPRAKSGRVTSDVERAGRATASPPRSARPRHRARRDESTEPAAAAPNLGSDAAGDEQVGGTEEPSTQETEAPHESADQPARGRPGRRPRDGSHSNALGVLIERRFADPSSPVRSYSELERRAGISREAISRYVTPRADRRRSPTIDTLAAIADAMRLSLERVCRAAVAGAHGVPLPTEADEQAREEVLAPLSASLSDEQFDAVVELLRQMQPRAEPDV